MQIHLRYFAAAGAALGRQGDDLDLADGATIETLVARLAPAELIPVDLAMAVPAPAASVLAAGAAGSPSESAAAVLARCSFLVNGVAVTDGSRLLQDGDAVDVLPPFAGG